MLLALLTAAPAARADGMFVWRNEQSDIREPEQKAVILSEAGWEDLILEVRYEGAPEEFGWIVPLPSEPQLEPSSPYWFVELSMRTQEPRYGGTAPGYGLDKHAGLSVVDVLQRKRVGIYEAAVLAACSEGALARWLADNGFQLPAGAEALLADYVRRGWTFTALKIAADAADTTTARRLGDGTIQPVRFRFRTAEPVFPLKISAANGDDADLLLYVIAPTALEPADGPRIAWETQACGPFAPWPELKAGVLAAYPALSRGEGSLTKLRARVRARDMEDLRFRPYDAAGRLGSDSPRVRAEGASQLGWSGDRAGAPPLLAFLEQARGTGQDVRSALWALGRIGDRAAIPALTAWAGSDDVHCRFEAFNALAALSAPEVVPLGFAEIRREIPVDLPGNDQAVARALREFCLGRLVACGDPELGTELRDIVDPAEGEAIWGRPPRFGMEAEERQRLALVVMAACGDRLAFAAIRRAVVAGGAAASRQMLHGDRRGRGGVQDFPDDLWGGTVIHRGAAPIPPTWPAGLRAHEMLAARPALRDSLYRAAAADTLLPDVGRSLLLSLLDAPRPGDAVVLREVWARALRSGRPRLVRITGGGSGRDGVPVVFNVEASCAACALGRLDRAQDLLQLLRDLPEAHRDLRGELCRALTLTRSALGIAAVTSYVRDVWDARAGSPDFREWLGVYDGTQRPAMFTPDRWGLDLPYRQAAITRYLTGADADTTLLEELVTDRGLDPYLRLYWLAAFPSVGDRFANARPRVLAVKEELGQALDDDALAVAALEQAHRRLWYGSDHALRRERARRGRP